MTEPQNLPRAEILRTRDFLGWPISDARGAKVGTVEDLLLDRTGQVRFLSVDPGLFRKGFLLPAWSLEWGESSLVLTGWSADELKALPPYDPARPMTAEVLEEMARAHPRFYADPHTLPGLPPRREEERIVPLREAKGFRVPKEATDPQGWSVFGADGERLGTVAGLLVDPVAMRVAYLDVDVADDLFQLGDDRHVAVPAARVDLRERGQDVWVQGLSAREAAALPAYTGGALDPLVEQRVDEAFAAADGPSVAGAASAAAALSPGQPEAPPEPAPAAPAPAEAAPPPLPPPAPGDSQPPLTREERAYEFIPVDGPGREPPPPPR